MDGLIQEVLSFGYFLFAWRLYYAHCEVKEAVSSYSQCQTSGRVYVVALCFCILIFYSQCQIFFVKVTTQLLFNLFHLLSLDASASSFLLAHKLLVAMHCGV